jgi:hypothetical protein
MAVTRTDGLFTDCKESGQDLRGKEYYFATRDANGKFVLCGDGGKIAGVITEGRDVGYHTSIDTGPQLKAVAESEIRPGDNVQSAGNGKAETGNNNSIGTAINHALGGEFVEIAVDRT